ncbi:MAG: hydrogenase iron-sulfur subunit [Promethearchaeota archaeon]
MGSISKSAKTKTDKPRIGVFVCECGRNIAGVIDCLKLADKAKHLDGVVVTMVNKYTCADPGQQEIKNAIKEHKLDRVVVASCTPRMHEPTFRRCVEDGGLNRFLFEMANIRDQGTWCHASDPHGCQIKADDLIASAVAKAHHLQPLETLKVPVTQVALVIGAGVSGIHSALDMADAGYKVYLVERSPTIGGIMALLDKCFPTLDCSICILGPKMAEAARHPNIELITCAEVSKVDGFVGNFRVTVKQRPRFVDIDKCNSCGDCQKVCPILVPNSFDANLGWRHAIYIPYPQAVPAAYVIDPDHCLGLSPNACMMCVEACNKAGQQAILPDDTEKIHEIDVGAIIVATGYEPYNPTPLTEYGYGVYPNVITAIELERLINAAGPTEGKIIRPSDKSKPHRFAFIQCVGSRDERANIYCSGFCCMYTIKNALLLHEKYPDAEITIYYMDIRTNFKDYEEFYRRARHAGIRFQQGRPAQITEDPATQNLIIHAEDMSTGRPTQREYDMVILSTAAVPSRGTEELARVLNVPIGPSGFFMEAHPKLKPVDAATEGVFFCGSAQGPKDIPASVAQGSAAASRALRIITQKEWEIEPIVAKVNPDLCRNVTTKCGICTTRCAYGAITAEPGKAAHVTPAKCHGCGTCVAECPAGAISQYHFTDEQIMDQIAAILKENPEDKILAFECNWCSYAGADLAGISRYDYPTTVRGIRVMCSGRISVKFVLEAFRRGAGMVLLSGCRLTETGSDCHYISGNVWTDKRAKRISAMLERIGIDPRRFRLEWVSAAEGDKWAAIIREMTEHLHTIGRDAIIAENERVRPELESRLTKLSKEESPKPKAAPREVTQ